MSADVLAEHFQAIWHRARNTASSVELITPAIVEACAKDRGLAVLAVGTREVGAFGGTPGVVLDVNGGRACFPTISVAGEPAWQRRYEAAEKRAAQWESVEWFEPFWIPYGQVEKLLRDARGRPPSQALEQFNYHTSTMYTLPFKAVCVAQVMPAARSLREFCPLAREAFLGFYSGHRASSIAALIPIMEGALTRIIASSGQADLTISDTVDRAIDGAVNRAAAFHYDGMWTPATYQTTAYLLGQDDRVFCFETFRRWLHRSFFRKTGEYDGATWLNRHLFAHGASSSWQQSANFTRLVVALATLGLIESWHDQSNAVTEFFPEMDEDSELLWQQAMFRAGVQGALKDFEAKRYQEHGRLVPELPTDDGKLLRRAALSEECVNDLVRPLRAAGWSVEMQEPTEDGLYVTVHAVAPHDELRVALLFTCATANETYKLLAQSCDVILYRGAPYHQDEYARGVDVHVGPVTGWQPPSASKAEPAPSSVSAPSSSCSIRTIVGRWLRRCAR